MHAQSFTSVMSPCDPMDFSPPVSSVHEDFPGKNTGVGCCALFQGIFPTQGLNLHLLHCRRIFLPTKPRWEAHYQQSHHVISSGFTCLISESLCPFINFLLSSCPFSPELLFISLLLGVRLFFLDSMCKWYHAVFVWIISNSDFLMLLRGHYY